jgi:hypothetical protein
MTTYYYYNNTNHSNTITDSSQQQQKQQPQLRSNIPKSIFTHNLNNDNNHSWSMTPLSPPLGKMDNTNGTKLNTTTSYHTVPTTPLSNRRSSNTWHSLWSSSTWQPNQIENEQTSPIDLEFLDSPFNDEKTSSINNNRYSTTSTAALDDYFQMKEGVINQSQAIPSPTRRPFQYSSGFIQKGDELFNHTGRERSASIWSFDWNSHPIPR